MRTFLEHLSGSLGAGVVQARSEEIEPWLTDWRGIYKGNAQAVVRPGNTAEVAQCMRLCHEYNVPVVPRGGNTGLCGGATPDANPDNVILCLDRMNRIRSLDTIANTLVADAGCILGNLRRAAAEADRLLPLSLAAEDSSHIGGNLATNAGGVNVVRYGMARELVLGIEAVLPDGEIFNDLGTLRKDNTGYDLKQLFIGSEGTLGVITGVACVFRRKRMCVQLYWPPSTRPGNRSSFCACYSAPAARACRRSSFLPLIALIWCWPIPRA